MNWVIAVVSTWWLAGLGAVSAVVISVVLWRWVLADLVLAMVELP